MCAHLYSMDFDELLKEVGAFGLYQKIIICSVLLPAALPCAFHAYRWVSEWKSKCILPSPRLTISRFQSVVYCSHTATLVPHT